MTDEIPDGLAQLREYLLNEFKNLLPEAASGSNDEKERNFLSRALAAYSIFKLANCSLPDAANAVVDGGGDGGIDAIYYARQTTDTLWIVQSKFVAKGTGEPDGLEKFRNGIEAILEGNLSYFEKNKAWEKWIPVIQAILHSSKPVQVRAVFVYSSINTITQDRLTQFVQLQKRVCYDDPDYFTYQSYNLISIVDWLTDTGQTIGVPEVDLTIHCPGYVLSPYETIYGLVKLSDIASLYQNYEKQLVAGNIRAYKGDTEVNQEIYKTLCESPESFLYLNNGLTAYCKGFRVYLEDRTKVEYKQVTIHDFSIINGAQTLGAIRRRFEETTDTPPDGYVFIKLISLKRHENDVQFAQLITRTANLQNRIDLRHFIAQQPYQKDLASKLLLSGIHYHFRDDADTPASDEFNFTLKDATTALACLEQLKDCDFVARVVANRQSLWSLDEDYPDNPLYPSRYSRVFRPDRPARTVWRAVQVQNVVLDKMGASARIENGVRKEFFSYARWLILNLIFLRLKPEKGNEMALSREDIDRIGTAAQDYAESLWTVCETLGYVSRRPDISAYETPHSFKTVFSRASDCARLRNGVLEKLNQKKPPVVETEGETQNDK